MLHLIKHYLNWKPAKVPKEDIVAPTREETFRDWFAKFNLRVNVCDIGASPIDPTPHLEKIVRYGNGHLVGFEPNPEQFDLLAPDENHTYEPVAIGDGEPHFLNLCRAPGMTSFLKPDLNYLGMFHHFTQWGTIYKQIEVPTTKLDDYNLPPQDYIKIDTQGFEKAILKYGKNTIKNSLVVEIECSPTPIYENEAPMHRIIQIMAKYGYIVHTIRPNRRAIKPMVKTNVKKELRTYTGLNHLFQADVVFVRDFRNWIDYSNDDLLKTACILDLAYDSYDLAYRMLQEYDDRTWCTYASQYLTFLDKLYTVVDE